MKMNGVWGSVGRVWKGSERVCAMCATGVMWERGGEGCAKGGVGKGVWGKDEV